MRTWLRNILAKAAVSAFSRSMASSKSSALLLSEDRKSQAVAIVWALVDMDEDVLERLEEKRAILGRFRTVVVVVRSLRFENLRQHGYYYESIPSVHELGRYGHHAAGRMYIARRISRIRRYYMPDFEVVLGENPDNLY